MADSNQTLTADKLCALTGLSDRRHRQLAKAGYFPPPKMGEYQLSATIRGLFKYYREGNQNSNEALLSEKIRETRHRSNLLEIEEKRITGEFFESKRVIQIWESQLVALRTALWNFDAPEVTRRRWMDELKAVSVAEYQENPLPVEAAEE